jgi:hypothetical protein
MQTSSWQSGISDDVMAAEKHFIQFLTRAIETGMQAGLLQTSDPEMSAYLLNSAMSMTMSRAIAFKDPPDIERLSAQAKELFYKALAPADADRGVLERAETVLSGLGEALGHLGADALPVRGGLGVSYDRIDTDRVADAITNPPGIQVVTLNNGSLDSLEGATRSDIIPVYGDVVGTPPFRMALGKKTRTAADIGGVVTCVEFLGTSMRTASIRP